MRLTTKQLQTNIGATADGKFGPKSKRSLRARLTATNHNNPTRADLVNAAERLGVTYAVIKAVTTVEAPRGAFTNGMPSMLYERHVFSRNTVPPGRFDKTHPTLSSRLPTPAGGYGLFSIQFDKLVDACGLDAEAAFRAVSWGAFQILGENAVKLGYDSAFDMAIALTESPAAHVDSFVRYVLAFGLVDELRQCRAGDPASCEPFVRGYNGPNYKKFDYHNKLAAAILAAER